LQGEDLRVKADEFQRNIQAAGAVRVPYLTEGAGSEFANQFVIRGIRDRSAARLQHHRKLPQSMTETAHRAMAVCTAGPPSYVRKCTCDCASEFGPKYN